jgi:alpha-tubulin suppressor-like RCC1 family protein
MSFPLSPSNNQVTLENGISYTYNASRNFWYRTPATALASITSNTFTVLNSIIFSDGTTQATAANPTDSFARTTANTATNNITILQGVNTTQNTRITIIEGVDTTQNTNISAAETKAQASFDAANTKLSTSGGTITGNLIVNAFTANTITANGVDLGTAVATAFLLANSANKTTTSDTAPLNPKVGDIWYDTVVNVTLRYNNDGVSNNWIDISGPQNAGYIFQSYSLSSNTTSLNESGSNTSVAITVSTINISDNTTLYWTISGSTPADFTDNANTGSVSIINNSATITRTIAADLVTEGAESFIAQLRTGSTSGPIVAIAPVITVADTSMDPFYALYSTGNNADGALGLNDRTNRSSPTQIGSESNWRLIAHGGFGDNANPGVSAAIKTNGTLWLWGFGQYGRLGQGDTISRSSPTQVGSLTSWSDVFVGAYGAFTMARRTDGTLWLWGRGYYGTLGQGNNNNYSSPKQLGTGTTWSKIGGSQNVAAAIKTDGTLWVWGNNSYGKLGLGDTTERNSPVQLGSGTDWDRLSQTGGGNWMGAIKTNGTLWTWGGNWQTQTGSNRSAGFTPVLPTQQTGSNWSRLAIGTDHGLGIKTDGTLWGWGNNSRGQLTNSVGGYASITQIGTNTNWAEVSTSQYETVALKTDGTIWAWGKNTIGMLGLNGEIGSYITSPRQIGSGTNWGAVAIGSVTLLRTNSQ